VVFTAAAIAVLLFARRMNARSPVAAAALIAAFMAVDLGWNNAPRVSTALPADQFEALRPNTNDQTVRLLKAGLFAAGEPARRRGGAAAKGAGSRRRGARPARPGGTHRHRLPLADPVARPRLRSCVRAQSA